MNQSSTSKLSDLKLERRYDPVLSGDLVKGFYEPCLSASVKYDRLSAYFTTESLKAASKGIHKLIANGGKIRFVFSNRIGATEMAGIEEGYRLRKMKELSDSLDEKSLSNDFDVANLARLIELGLAEVKIVFMVQDEALCHQKLGVFEDAYGNAVFFEGSGNETASGWNKNSETFTVFCSWDEGDNRRDVIPGKERFERIWNNTYAPTRMLAYEPTEEMYAKLKSMSKGRFFRDEAEFFLAKNCVLLDVDEEAGEIDLADFTEKHWLNKPMVLSSHYRSDWKDKGDGHYGINGAYIHTIKEIEKYLSDFEVPLELTDRAKEFCDTYNLELEKQVKLATAIKTETDRDLWNDSYCRFSYIVNRETTVKLKEHQMLNAFFHASMKSSADYSVPGTGKTYIAYGLYAYLTSPEARAIDILVVFGPLNCFMAWKEEGKAIFQGKRSLSFYDHSESKSDWKRAVTKEKYNVYLLNYEAFDRNAELAGAIAENLLGPKTMVIFDESHRIKNPNGIRAQAILWMLNNAKGKPIYRLSLTGTPLPNSFVDIYNQIQLLYPDEKSTVFRSISIPDLKRADENGYAVRHKIEETLYPTFVRIRKEDLEIPPADPDDRDTLLVSPNAEEDELYRLLKRRYFQDPLSLYIRMIQATSNPRLLCEALNLKDVDFTSIFDDGDVPEGLLDIRDDVYLDKEVTELAKSIGVSSKTKAALDLIKSLASQGRKVLVWCLFVDSIRMVERELRNAAIEAVTISGADLPESRFEKLKRFRDGAAQVLITNPNTLAESVSLHKACHDAVYLEYGFNLTYMLQSKDRIHRVGLPEGTKTHYYYAITEKTAPDYGSIDGVILERLDKKARRMYEAIENEDLAVLDGTKETLDDIKDIMASTYGN